MVLCIAYNSEDKFRGLECQNDYRSSIFCNDYFRIVNTPSFKVALNFTRFGVLSEATLICKGYCSSHTIAQSTTFNSVLNHNKRGIIELHKILFRLAKGRGIPARISHTNRRFYEESHNKDLSCEKAFKMRQYQLIKNPCIVGRRK